MFDDVSIVTYCAPSLCSRLRSDWLLLKLFKWSSKWCRSISYAFPVFGIFSSPEFHDSFDASFAWVHTTDTQPKMSHGASTPHHFFNFNFLCQPPQLITTCWKPDHPTAQTWRRKMWQRIWINLEIVVWMFWNHNGHFKLSFVVNSVQLM